MKLLIMHSSPLPRYLVPLSPKYPPEPMFLPLCERPRFTPMQNNRQNYSQQHLITRQ